MDIKPTELRELFDGLLEPDFVIADIEEEDFAIYLDDLIVLQGYSNCSIYIVVNTGDRDLDNAITCVDHIIDTSQRGYPDGRYKLNLAAVITKGKTFALFPVVNPIDINPTNLRSRRQSAEMIEVRESGVTGWISYYLEDAKEDRTKNGWLLTNSYPSPIHQGYLELRGQADYLPVVSEIPIALIREAILNISNSIYDDYLS